MRITRFEDVLKILDKEVNVKLGGGVVKGYFTRGSFTGRFGYTSQPDDSVSLVFDETVRFGGTYAGNINQRDFEKNDFFYIEYVEYEEDSKIKNNKEEKKDMREIEEIKVGDKVVLSVPEGRKFVEGTADETGFKYGIVNEMIRIVMDNEVFTVAKVASDRLDFGEDGENFTWDKSWFKKVNTAKNRNSVSNIKIVMDGKETLAIVDDKIGKALKHDKDDNSDNIGVIVSVMRVLDVDKDTQTRVIDALFNKVNTVEKIVEKEVRVEKTFSDFSTKEIVKELSERFSH